MSKASENQPGYAQHAGHMYAWADCAAHAQIINKYRIVIVQRMHEISCAPTSSVVLVAGLEAPSTPSEVRSTTCFLESSLSEWSDLAYTPLPYYSTFRLYRVGHFTHYLRGGQSLFNLNTLFPKLQDISASMYYIHNTNTY